MAKEDPLGIVNTDLKKLEKIRQADLRFVKQQGPVSQEKGAKALQVQLKKNYKGQQRLGILKRKEDQLVKQILNSEEKSSRLLEKDLINLRLEQDNLRQQVKYTDQIATNNERGAIAVRKKSLASKRQLKLDRKAGVAGSVAGIAGVAETRGTMAAFRELRVQAGGTFEHIDEAGRKTQKSFGLMSRSAIRLKGSLSILTTGVSKLMMALGPIMMAFML